MAPIQRPAPDIPTDAVGRRFERLMQESDAFRVETNRLVTLSRELLDRLGVPAVPKPADDS